MSFRRTKSAIHSLNRETSILISGVLEIADTKVKSFVVIHRTSTQHFAIFYPIQYQAFCNQVISTINLKSFQAKQLSKDRIVIRSRKDVDRMALTLKVVNLRENSVERWLDAFTYKSTKFINYDQDEFNWLLLPPVLENSNE